MAEDSSIHGPQRKKKVLYPFVGSSKLHRESQVKAIMAQFGQAPHSWLRTSLYIDPTFILARVFVRCCYVPF